MSLNGLGVKKFESVNFSMIIKTGMVVIQYCTVFNYGTPIPQKGVNPKDKNIVSDTGF